MYCTAIKCATSTLRIDARRMIRPCSPAAFNSFNSAMLGQHALDGGRSEPTTRDVNWHGISPEKTAHLVK